MAQVWRTTEDISYDPGRVKWETVVRNFELNAQHATFTGPNSWNDPDMLEVGNAGLTPIESRTHYSMWAIPAAPIWPGTDLTQMDAQTLAPLTNPEVIAVDQDALGAGIRPLCTGTNGIEIWTKPLGAWTGESQAVLLTNLSSSAKSIALFWRDLGLLPGVAVRDLWARTDLGRFPDRYSVEIPSHGSVLLKISAALSGEKGVVYEAEWPGHLRPQGANLISCATCSSRGAVALAGSANDGKGLIFPQIDAPNENSYEFSVAYLGNTSPANSLPFVVNNTARGDVIISQDERGHIREDKKGRGSIANIIKPLVASREEWERVKAERLHLTLDGRLPANWPAVRLGYKQRDYVLAIGGHSGLCGIYHPLVT